MSSEINIRVKQLRGLMKLTQTAFCTQVGIKQGTLSDIERFRINVSPKTLEKISETLGVLKEWLYTGKGDIFAEAENNVKYGKNVPEMYQKGANNVATKEKFEKELQYYTDIVVKNNPRMRFVFKSLDELKISHPKLIQLHYDISVLSALLIDCEAIYNTYLDSAINQDIKAENYNEYKEQMILHLSNYTKYTGIVNPFIKNLKLFLLDFKKYDTKNVIEHYNDELTENIR